MGPGESVSRSVQVVFPESGSHVVSAACADDALSSDNRVSCVLNLVDNQKLLLVDDSADRRAAVYLRSALAPGEITRTGWQVTTESSAHLRDTQLESLLGYAAIFLCDVNNLDDRSIRNLTNYVEAGGGLAIFPGRTWQPSDVTRMSQLLGKTVASNDDAVDSSKPESLLPVQLKSIRQFNEQEVSDPAVQTLTVETHPIFEPLLNLAASPFQFIRFFQILEIDDRPTDASLASSKT